MRDDALRKSCNLRDVVNISGSGANDFDGLIITNVSVNRLLGVFGFRSNPRGEMSLSVSSHLDYLSTFEQEKVVFC